MVGDSECRFLTTDTTSLKESREWFSYSEVKSSK